MDATSFSMTIRVADCMTRGLRQIAVALFWVQCHASIAELTRAYGDPVNYSWEGSAWTH